MSSRKLRLYLFSLILLALAVGMIYYAAQRNQVQITAEGTLI